MVTLDRAERKADWNARAAGRRREVSSGQDGSSIPVMESRLGSEELSRFVIHQIGHGEIEALVAEVEPWKVAEATRYFEAHPLDGKGPVASALRS